MQPLADGAQHVGELFSTWWWLIAIVVALAILRARRSRKSRDPLGVAAGPSPYGRQGRHRGGYPRSTERWKPGASRSDVARLGDPKAQQDFIDRVDFRARRLLNKPEYRILRILEKVTREIGGGHRVMAQVSLGEVIAPQSTLASDEALAFRSINSKRLDFLVIDRTGMPALAVEYQGHGHYQNGAFQRDAVKREAVRKAGIPWQEIAAEYNDAVEESRIREALQPRLSWEKQRRVASPPAR